MRDMRFLCFSISDDLKSIVSTGGNRYVLAITRSRDSGLTLTASFPACTIGSVVCYEAKRMGSTP